ncbi:hypothetical protein [Pseudomonas sp. PA27(2017)]|uniref:hypothetical protein n=1 Tax=Pseudomonas sp. PA27(2017) TaxID=1932112 RepID=UPI00143A9EFE|nr:hypothetical protein [Pseudomonas sp. PA27(2017)]
MLFLQKATMWKVIGCPADLLRGRPSAQLDADLPSSIEGRHTVIGVLRWKIAARRRRKVAYSNRPETYGRSLIKNNLKTDSYVRNIPTDWYCLTKPSDQRWPCLYAMPKMAPRLKGERRALRARPRFNSLFFKEEA